MNSARQQLAIKPRWKFVFTLTRITYPLSRWLFSLSLIAVSAMMLLIAADVFMRRAFNSPIFGAYDVIKILLVIIVFTAVAYVMTVREHVIVDSITRLYPKKFKQVITGISQIFNLLILALICWQSFNYGLSMLRVGERLVLLKIPMSPFVFVVAFGYAIFFIIVLVQFLQTLTGVDEDTGQPSFTSEGNNGQR